MLGNLQTWLGRDSVPRGDTPADRTPVLPQDGLQAGILNQGSMLEQETAKVVFTNTGPGQAFLVVSPRWGADAAPAARAAYDKIACLLQAQGLAIVHERLFGSLGVKPAIMVARNAALSAASPVTYIQGQPPWGEGLAGVIIRAVSCRQPQDEVWTIQDQGKPVGRGWRQGDATFLILQNLPVGAERNFDGLHARWMGQVKLPKDIDLKKKGSSAYKPTTVARKSQMDFGKGKPVFILDDPEGNPWVMQAYSLIVDPNLTYDPLRASAAS
jgi:hypothetical protein